MLTFFVMQKSLSSNAKTSVTSSLLKLIKFYAVEWMFNISICKVVDRFSLQEIYKDRKKFSKAVFEVASSDLVNMGISVVSYTLKDIRDEEVSRSFTCFTVM